MTSPEFASAAYGLPHQFRKCDGLRPRAMFAYHFRRGKTQERPGDGQSDERQIFDDVLNASVERIFRKVNGECVGDVVHPNRPEEPLPSGTQRLL